jgi:DNA-binding response OmpR family regulator
MKIIILDDNKTLTNILSKKFEKELIEVIVYNSLYSFKYEEVDLYIIDI